LSKNRFFEFGEDGGDADAGVLFEAIANGDRRPDGRHDSGFPKLPKALL